MIMDGGPDIKKKLTQFMQGRGRTAIPVLIISYETFRMHANILHSSEIGLVLCDEGHRYFLKDISQKDQLFDYFLD